MVDAQFAIALYQLSSLARIYLQEALTGVLGATSEKQLRPLAILCRRDCVLLVQPALTNVRAIFQFCNTPVLLDKVKYMCNVPHRHL